MNVIIILMTKHHQHARDFHKLQVNQVASKLQMK